LTFCLSGKLVENLLKSTQIRNSQKSWQRLYHQRDIWNVKSAVVYCNNTVLALPFICFQNWIPRCCIYCTQYLSIKCGELLIETTVVYNFYMVSEHSNSNESPIQNTTMSSSSDQNPNFTLNTQPSSTADKPLSAFNIASQIIEKLTPFTFPQWCAQFEALLIGYDLLDHVKGTLLCPSSSGTATDELCKLY